MRNMYDGTIFCKSSILDVLISYKLNPRSILVFFILQYLRLLYILHISLRSQQRRKNYLKQVEYVKNAKCFRKLTTKPSLIIFFKGLILLEVKFYFNYQSETLWVIKTFHFHKLKYLFQRFRCHKHPFSRTTYDVLHF